MTILAERRKYRHYPLPSKELDRWSKDVGNYHGEMGTTDTRSLGNLLLASRLPGGPLDDYGVQ